MHACRREGEAGMCVQRGGCGWLVKAGMYMQRGVVAGMCVRRGVEAGMSVQRGVDAGMCMQRGGGRLACAYRCGGEAGTYRQGEGEDCVGE